MVNRVSSYFPKGGHSEIQSELKNNMNTLFHVNNCGHFVVLFGMQQKYTFNFTVNLEVMPKLFEMFLNLNNSN